MKLNSANSLIFIIIISSVLSLTRPVGVLAQTSPTGAPDTSSISVISPAGGEQWQVGSQQTINWLAPSSVTSVSITASPYIACIYSNPHCDIAVVSIPVATNIPNTGSFSWPIPASLSVGPYTLSITDGLGMSAQSQIFNIVAASAMSLISPKGGEQWQVGSRQTITWSAPSSVTGLNITVSPYYSCMSAIPRCVLPTPYLPPIASQVPNSGSYNWTLGSNLSPGQYSLTIADSGNSGLYSTSGVFNIITAASGAAHAVGANILSGGTVYFISPPQSVGAPLPCPTPQAATPCPASEPYLVPYPSAAVFESYGFNSWANVAPATAGDLALSKSGVMNFAYGTLVSDQGTVYLISACKTGFASAQAFLAMGYNWGSVISGDASNWPDCGNTVSAIGAHPAGTLISQNGTIYLVTAYGKMGFPSLSVFDSWGFSLSGVVLANSFDAGLTADPYGAIVQAREMGQLSPVASPVVP